ncbi:SigE family RNA polymerase sigma factor [Cryptosporangium minutisporangium]|uniref:SigE family RNA polymerase sigma factor n=1 Tax=Cryptosporangium minutisporangium TaxID=113569 RepID=A0ABP6T4D8_9ACTN
MPSTPDRAGFDAFAAAHGTALLRFAFLLTGNYHLAEDMLQEALMRVHRRWTKLERPEAISKYVRKAILRQYLSWRRLRSSAEMPSAVAPDTPLPGSDHAERYAERDALRNALTALPRQQRAVLVLRFYEDLDDTSIGELIGCSPITVRAHASRGLARLRGQLPSQESTSTAETSSRGRAR